MKKAIYIILTIVFSISLISASYNQLMQQSSSVLSLKTLAPAICTDPDVVLHFDLNDCHSFIGTTNADYSEFRAYKPEEAECANYKVLGGYLYRLNPEQNLHSCTPGVGDSDAMCIMSLSTCEYPEGHDASIRFDIVVEPNDSDEAILSGISFYEQAPENYNWISGSSGPNNYPTRYAIRVLSEGQVIYLQTDITTNRNWNLQMFDFTDIEAFNVSDTTVFNFELLPYCNVGNGAAVAVWDIDELSILSCCELCQVVGGELTTTDETDICIDDESIDLVEVNLSGEFGENQNFMVLDEFGYILKITDDTVFNFEDAPEGICTIMSISYDGSISGFDIGYNIEQLFGCYELSNGIEIVRSSANGGTISTSDPTLICSGDGEEDLINVDLQDNIGNNQQWLITDVDGIILDDSSSPPFDFEGVPAGVCNIYHLSSHTSFTESLVGTQISDFTGCISLSNPIQLIRESISAGNIQTPDDTNICSGDGLDDIINVELNGAVGDTMLWLITDESGELLSISLDPVFNFEGQDSGVCIIWNGAFTSGTNLPEIADNIFNIEGCHALSNGIEVTRNYINGGTISSDDPLEICSGDGIEDIINVDLTDSEGAFESWIIADVNGIILENGASPPFDFEGVSSGICQIMHLSHHSTITGNEPGNNISDIAGCFNLSNSIIVNRSEISAGSISTSDPLVFCTGDEIEDVVNVTVTDVISDFSSYVITDTAGVIIALNESGIFDFSAAESGLCFINHIAYNEGATIPDLGLNISELTGCLQISNTLNVVRTSVLGSIISTSDLLEICVGDDNSNLIDVSIDQEGSGTSIWIISDENGIVQSIPAGPPFNVEGLAMESCQIQLVNYSGAIGGLAIGESINGIEGCFVLSNAIIINKTFVDGGQISTSDPTSICIANGNSADINLNVVGNQGAFNIWVLTELDGTILETSNEPVFNFDDAGTGSCLIIHIAYEIGNFEFIMGSNINDLPDCFSISNPIIINRTEVIANEIVTADETEFCVADGIPDSLRVQTTQDQINEEAWIITDTSGLILELPLSPEFDFEGVSAGICLIWHLSYESPLLGLETGFNLSNLAGCFALSNSISVTRNNVDGGELSTVANTNLCVGQGLTDTIHFDLMNAAGNFSQFVVTDEDGNIINTQDEADFYFDNAGVGSCLVWHVSSDNQVDWPALTNINQLEGCFSLSNAVGIIRNEVDPLVISTMDETTLCLNDEIPDIVNVDLMGTIASNFQWILADTLGNILDVAALPPFNFSSAGEGVCDIWLINFEDGLEGLQTNNNLNDITGCFALSNNIRITRSLLDAGFIFAAGPTNFCLNDDEVDTLNVNLINNSGGTSSWIITDEAGIIIDLPLSQPFDFSNSDPGECHIYNLSYSGSISGAQVGLNISDLEGCFELSNSISVSRELTLAGTISTTDGEDRLTICVSDIMPDTIFFESAGTVGPNFSYIITDDQDIVLVMPMTDYFDFNDSGVGTCRVYGLSYSGIRTVLPGDNINSAMLSTSCFDVSDSYIEVIRVDVGDVCAGFTTMLMGDIEFALFPNPVKEEVYVDIDRLPYVMGKIELVDSYGRVLETKSIGSHNMDRIPFDLSDYPLGIYFVRISSVGQKLSRRFVKF